MMQTRTEIETLIVGKTVAKIRWSTHDDFRHPVWPDSTDIDGLDFTDGSYASVCGSPQLEIAAVGLWAYPAKESS